MALFDNLRRFMRALDTEVFSASAMYALGEQGRDIIYKRTKSGKSLNGTPLRSLSPAYVLRRRLTGVPGAFGAAQRSNLTYTGQLLDSFEIESKDRQFSIIIPNTRRKSPPTQSGQKYGQGNDRHTNSQVAELVEKNGRPFFGMTIDERQILIKEVEENIRRVLNRFL